MFVEYRKSTKIKDTFKLYFPIFMNKDVIRKSIDSLVNMRVINGKLLKKETIDSISELEKELSKLLNNKQKTKDSYDKEFQNFLDESLGRKNNIKK